MATIVIVAANGDNVFAQAQADRATRIAIKQELAQVEYEANHLATITDAWTRQQTIDQIRSATLRRRRLTRP